jgi:DnaK suppressor protein
MNRQPAILYAFSHHRPIAYMGQNSDDECTTQREAYSYPKMAPSLDDKGHNIGYNIVEIRMRAVLILPSAGERKGTMLVQADMAQRERQLLQELRNLLPNRVEGPLPVGADNLQRRNQIEEEIKRVQAQIESAEVRLRQGVGWGSDEADKANDLVERTKALTFHRHLVQKRQQLEHVKARLDQGLDGACEMCGRQIDPARLRAVIGTTRCVTCQRRLEQGISRRFRT